MVLIYESLLVCAWLAERSLLRRIRTESGDPIGAAQTDRSFVGMLIFYFLLLQIPVMRASRMREILPREWWLVVLGAAIAMGGTALRIRAIRYLRENFSYVVNVGERHTLVTSGPYRLVRHPAYTGLLVYFTGLLLVLCDFYMTLIVLTVVGIVVVWRVLREERWLKNRFGDAYTAWSARTKLLIPHIL